MTEQPYTEADCAKVHAYSLPGHDRDCARAIHAQAAHRTTPLDTIQVEHLLAIGMRAGRDAALRAVVDSVAEVLVLTERKLAALHYTTMAGLPFVGRECVFGAVNDVAREVGVWDAYVAAARAAGPGLRGERLSLLELARRNGDIPAVPVPVNEENVDG